MILGTAQLGMDYGIANQHGCPSYEQAFAILDEAQKNGIEEIDTAEAYGRSEEIIAAYLRRNPKSFLVNTKLFSEPFESALDRTSVVKIVEKKCYKLGVEKLGCVFLHRFEDVKNTAILEGLTLSKQRGFTARIGVSIYDPFELDFIADKLAEVVDVVQLPLNVLTVGQWENTLRRAHSCGITIHARSLYLQGLLLLDSLDPRVSALKATEYVSKLDSRISSLGMSTACYCMGIINAEDCVDDIVIGCETLTQLNENIELEKLSKQISVSELTWCKKEFPNIPRTITNPSLWPEPNSQLSTLAILQARMGSTRLPGKVLQDVAGKPMLERIVSRLDKAQSLNDYVIATTVLEEDNAIAEFCSQKGIRCFRGSALDVLDRYYQCAQEMKADIVVRLTADNPFVDPTIVDEAMRVFRDGFCDYVRFRKGLPLGTEVEVCSFYSLKAAWIIAEDEECREHVTPFMYKNPSWFKCKIAPCTGKDNSNIRLTVDTEEDLKTASNIFCVMDDQASVADVIALIDMHPELVCNNDISQTKLSYAGETKRALSDPKANEEER